MPHIYIVTPDGVGTRVEVPDGRSVLDACRKSGLPMEGLCGGEMDCSTCHVIVDPIWFDKLPAATEDEEDMLDLIPSVTETSRLGCQVKITAALDGLTLKLPAENKV
ncbi:2Fe-2S iron-sulfur cluster-binding protein [Caballeronia mineralivorans]|jgi:2Fe-2S ferredoxin|uniref:2Fe-2S iron-sulfur cluster-binding protein n=1 Tax=Caballeronia mineralivorans TaxID=2010198 RepID=UPI002B1A3E55|nr:Ferredoxin [Caballeronia mineralivorans]MEA3104531.1 ferredoxin, 2Fe-2S [Caballeronia mineralivorans]